MAIIGVGMVLCRGGVAATLPPIPRSPHHSLVSPLSGVHDGGRGERLKVGIKGCERRCDQIPVAQRPLWQLPRRTGWRISLEVGTDQGIRDHPHGLVSQKVTSLFSSREFGVSVSLERSLCSCGSLRSSENPPKSLRAKWENKEDVLGG